MVNAIVVFDLLDAALTEDPSLVKNGDEISHPADEFEVMLDHYGRDLMGNLSYDLGHFLGLSSIHACGWLIEEQNGRGACHGDSQFEALLLSVGQAIDSPHAGFQQPNPLEHFKGLRTPAGPTSPVCQDTER
jgi:hypothetical protein